MLRVSIGTTQRLRRDVSEATNGNEQESRDQTDEPLLLVRYPLPALKDLKETSPSTLVPFQRYARCPSSFPSFPSPPLHSSPS